MDVGTYELPRWAKKRRSSKRARVLSTSYDFLQGHCSKYDSLEKRRRAGGTDDPEQGNFGPLDLCSIPFSGDGTRFGSTEGLRKSAGSCCAKNTRTEQVLAGFEDPWEHTLKSTELSLKFYNNTNHGVGFELVEPVCSHTFSAFVVGYPTTYWQHVSFKARPKGSCSSDLSTKLFFAEMARGSSQWNVTACTIVDPNDSGSAADSICKCWRICKLCVSGIRHPASGFEAGMQGLRIKNDSARARDGRFSIRCRGVPVTLSELIEIKTKEENKRNAKVARTKEELAEDHRELSIKGSELALEFYNSTNDGVNFELVETVCSRFFVASTIDLCCAHWRHVNFKARPKVSCSGDPSTMLFFAELRKKKLSEWIVTVCTILDPNGSANGTEYRCKCGKPEGVCEICGSFIRHPHPSTGFQGLQNSAGGCCAKNTRTKQVLAGVEDPWERTLKSTELALKFYNNTNHGVGFELVVPVCSHTFTAFVVGYPTTYWQHVNFKARPKGSCSSDLSTKLFFAEMARGSSQWNVTACTIVDPNDSGSATDSICKCWRICKVCVSGIRHPASGFEAGMQVLRIKNDSARARDGSIRYRGVPVTLSELIEIKTKEENKRNAKVARTKEELAEDHRELTIKGSELALEFYNSTNDGEK